MNLWNTDCADTSIIRTRSRQELLYPRSQMATAAKAFGLQCIDMVRMPLPSYYTFSDPLFLKVCVNYQEEDVLREECDEARRLGYDGKVRTHLIPSSPISNTFTPSASNPP
jgi:citrate lyase subunit beta-like protein